MEATQPLTEPVPSPQQSLAPASHLLFPSTSHVLLESARSSTTRIGVYDDDMDTPDNADEPQVESAPAVPEPTPQTSLTFLLVDGRRRTMAFDPTTTVGRVKELVWNAWPSGVSSSPLSLDENSVAWGEDAEWQADRPPAPSYLRILYLGKILQDEDTLAKLAFPTHIPCPTPPSEPTSNTEAPPPAPSTIVHLSIRAYAPPPDDAPKKKKSTRRRGTGASEGESAAGAPPVEEEEGAGCCCVIC
ncbi:Ubiquitin-like protein 3 [Mycena sanguinolenta]|uniref:Ubiquitin-like protein 3 n=1 Tax=Mycena sanguinolenta TaxID=230812 RepID=A0A8H6Y5W4_9AGAR|nr:Ubiquitin-like protein 3 [Mycena sanguinolenta]